MGLRTALRLVSATAELVPVPSPATVESMPAEIAAAFGMPAVGDDHVTRLEALSVPAVRRGRAIIAGTLGTLPLVALRAGTAERVRRALLEQPDPNTTAQYMLTYTLDDLLFYGVAWWQVTAREAVSVGLGYPTAARRLAPGQVSVEERTGVVRVDGVPVDDRDVIRFDGPDEGLLRHGARTLRTCLLLEEAVRRFARLDVPLGVLRQAEGSPAMTDEQVEGLLQAWEDARRRHTTAFLNKALTYESEQFDAERIQLAEARQYQNAEVARLLNLPGRYVGASEGDSLTYSNAESARRDLVDTSLAPWICAVEQRLTMPDVTPRGQLVRFDLSTFVRGDTATAMQAAEVAIRAGVLTAAEVRADLFNRPALPEQAAPPLEAQP